KVHVRSWQIGYEKLLPKQYLDSLNPRDRASRYDFSHNDINRPCTFVAVDGDSVVGFVTIRASSSSKSKCGELNALYVDPDHWRLGIGSRLLTFAVKRFAELDLESAILWVLKDNARAMHSYEKQGWVANNHSKTDCIWGINIEELQYKYNFAGNSMK
ncbi:MAG: GNAT family N-acetyltransferase, partial [Steroidobacter sp.]